MSRILPRSREPEGSLAIEAQEVGIAVIGDEEDVGSVHSSVHVCFDMDSPILVLRLLDDRLAGAHAEAEESPMVVGGEVFLLRLVGLSHLTVKAVRAGRVVLRTGRE